MRHTHAHADESPLRPSRTSPGLLFVGVAMLGVQVAISDARSGGEAWTWPWDVVQDAGALLSDRAAHVLWAATALWAVCTALTRAARPRAAVLGALAAATIVVALFGVDRFTLGGRVPAEWLGLVVLGGGLLIAGEPSTRGLGRALAALGALVVIWVLATTFPAGGGPNRLQRFGEDAAAAFGDPADVWEGLLGQALLLLGCAAGVLAMFGLTARGLVWAGIGAILAGLLAPGVIDAFQAEHFEVQMLIPVAVGAVLWALGAFTIEDLSRGAS